jgi:uncharacterized protein
MHLIVLGATGATGSQLTQQALERGHTVTAIARDPSRIALPGTPGLTKVAGDVFDPASIASAISADAIVLSGLGLSKGGQPGVLAAGAAAVIAAGPRRIIWLGAFGTGRSADAAGRLTSTVLGLALKSEIADKVAADTAILQAGGTVFHSGPLSNASVEPLRHTATLAAVPKRLFPARIGRATVAAAMLDEAEAQVASHGVVVPLSGRRP